MLRTRVLSAAILLPIVLTCIYFGGMPFLLLVALLLTLAEIEFCRLMTRSNFQPATILGLGFVWLFLIDAQWGARLLPQGLLRPGLTLLMLTSLAWQLFHRRGYPVADWALTVVGGLYLGLGAFIIGLRNLPDGLWWTLTAIPAILFADSGAYFVGRAWGRHKLAPTLSPGKTWEGYLAGIVTGGVLTMALASLWHSQAGTAIAVTGTHGLILGVLIGTLAPLGDLAVSMVKRQAGAKDSGNIIPGHGGALDRVDSVLWAAVIGYYYAQIFTNL